MLMAGEQTLLAVMKRMMMEFTVEGDQELVDLTFRATMDRSSSNVVSDAVLDTM